MSLVVVVRVHVLLHGDVPGVPHQGLVPWVARKVCNAGGCFHRVVALWWAGWYVAWYFLAASFSGMFEHNSVAEILMPHLFVRVHHLSLF